MMDDEKKRLAGRVTTEVIDWLTKAHIQGDVAVTALIAAATALAIVHKQQAQFHQSVSAAINQFDAELKVREVIQHAKFTVH